MYQTVRACHSSTPKNIFFQAEDGIRGPLVTGVQTCALPISSAVVAADTRKFRSGAADLGGDRVRYPSFRSEERRVGKECRSCCPQEIERKMYIKSTCRIVRWIPEQQRSSQHDINQGESRQGL